jgi:hypothetical protein
VGGLDVTMSFTLQGGPELQRRLHAIGGTPKVILGNLGIRAVREAKLIVPRRTGRALKVGYAAYVEYGTGAHDIIPRQRKALAWGGERTLGGRLRAGSRATHFAKRVHHPGTKPHPFLVPGLMLALKAIGLDDMVKRWNGAA